MIENEFERYLFPLPLWEGARGRGQSAANHPLPNPLPEGEGVPAF